jgi:plasmid stabilization system protein ParE
MRIIWSEPALADLEAIHEFIARDSRQYATRFVQRLLEAAERLAALPMLGRIVPEGDGRHREVFEAPYRVENDVVHVVRLVRGARDFDALRRDLEATR